MSNLLHKSGVLRWCGGDERKEKRTGDRWEPGAVDVIKKDFDQRSDAYKVTGKQLAARG